MPTLASRPRGPAWRQPAVAEPGACVLGARPTGNRLVSKLGVTLLPDAGTRRVLDRANDRRDPLAGDRLGYDVLNRSDLSRVRGAAGDLDLSHVHWGNDGLVVIDESHDPRNRRCARAGTTRTSSRFACCASSPASST